MDFVVISASEISPVCREWCSQNYPGRFQHFYDSIEAQLLGGSVCASCSEKVVSQLLGPCKPKGDLRPNSSVAILFTGSPCDPFSTQRSKRFVSGNVKDHSQFDVTMEKVIQLYVQYEPEKGVLEQVWGFTLPFAADDPETPKSRPSVSKNCNEINENHHMIHTSQNYSFYGL